MNPYEDKGFRKPTMPRIDRSVESEDLYKAEEQMHEAIHKATIEFVNFFKPHKI